MLLPNIHRDRDQIAEPVRNAIRQCWAGKSAWPLVLTGCAGSGKTCASLCMVDHYGGMHWVAERWVERIRDAKMGQATWSTGYPASELGIWQQWSGAKLCVLDELGSRSKVSDHHYETVKRAIDERHGLPLVCVSNLDIPGLSTVYDDRIASRLSAGTIVVTEGDRRVHAAVSRSES